MRWSKLWRMFALLWLFTSLLMFKAFRANVLTTWFNSCWRSSKPDLEMSIIDDINRSSPHYHNIKADSSTALKRRKIPEAMKSRKDLISWVERHEKQKLPSAFYSIFFWFMSQHVQRMKPFHSQNDFDFNTNTSTTRFIFRTKRFVFGVS